MATAVINQTRLTTSSKLGRYKKTTKIAPPFSADVSRKGYTIDEIQEMMYDKLSAHYGVDVRTL